MMYHQPILRIYLLLGWWGILQTAVDAFNLEARVPLVKTAGDYSDSFFGYSVAQHITANGEPLILVGAPQDRNLQPGTERSGALYSCPLTTASRDCVQIETDGKRHNSSRMYGIYDGSITGPNLVPPVTSEIKEGQWLGVSLASQGKGGSVIVCAHRYTVRDVDKFSHTPVDSKRAILGMCYILHSDLTMPLDTTIGAKNILVVREAMRGKSLELVNDFDNHAKFGACQVGTASAWVKQKNLVNMGSTFSGTDSGGSLDYALFGAPGCFTWRGNVLGQKTSTTGSYSSAVHDKNYLGYTKHGHLGLALTSGRYFDGEVQFVSGAPHGREGESGSGVIYFFSSAGGSDLIDESRDKTTKSQRLIHGGGFGSGFGYSLETLDVNGDGHDDLLVGAPFCDNKGRGGSVYLYINEKMALHNNKFIEVRGHGQEGQFGLAISTLSDVNKDGLDDFVVGAPYEGKGVVYLFLGSRSFDSETNSGDKVKRNVMMAEEMASQIIKAEDFMGPSRSIPLNGDLDTFGSSLSGGVDLDGNNYPDLVVGSFKANTVALLLARPIINVTTSVDDSQLQRVDPGQSGCQLDPKSPHSCFQFSACFRVETNDTKLDMAIRFNIVAEPNKPVSRVWLRLADNHTDVADTLKVDGRTNRVEHVLFIQNVRQETCTKILGYLSDQQADIQTPVKFALSYTLVQEEPRIEYDKNQPLIDVDRYPILNQKQALRTFYAKFQRNCGPDDICQAQLAIKPRLLDGPKELAKNNKGIYELELGTLSDNQLTLDVNVKNLGEAAYEAKLVIVHPSSISYVGLGNMSDINAPEVVNSTSLSFNLGNPFKGNHSMDFQIRFAPHSVINDTLITFEFHVNTTSKLAVDSSTYLHSVIVRRAELKISGKGLPSTVFYGGTVRGESALNDVSEIGPLIQHRYEIRNYGPSDVDVVTVKVKWPFQVENNKPQGKWLLYLTDHPTLKNGIGDCTLPAGYGPNPLNLTSKLDQIYHRRRRLNQWRGRGSALNIQHDDRNSFGDMVAEKLKDDMDDFLGSSIGSVSNRRRKREVEQIVAPIRVKARGGDNLGEGEQEEKLIVRLDCERGTAKCLTITCQMYNISRDQSVTVEIRSRLWNSTLVEDYYDKIDRVEVFSKASVIVDTIYTQDVSNDYESILTTALPDIQLEPTRNLDWWIYVVAAGCGLLVLVFIVLILWKLGFFKRTRPVDDDSDFMVSAHFEKVKLNSNGDL